MADLIDRQPPHNNDSNTLDALDCVSRKAAIDATWFEPYYTDPLNVLTEVRDRLEALPSAQPERKKGKYIGTEYDGYADGNPVYYEWKCSECGCIFEDEEPTYNFCPNCGADMRGEQDG